MHGHGKRATADIQRTCVIAIRSMHGPVVGEGGPNAMAGEPRGGKGLAKGLAFEAKSAAIRFGKSRRLAARPGKAPTRNA